MPPTHRARFLDALGQERLDRTSGIPLYIQAAAAIERVMARQPPPTGEPLPAESDLAAAVGISRPTVRQALRQLSERNILTIRRGMGAFPSVGVIVRPTRATSLYSDLLQAGLQPTTDVLSLSVGRIDPEVATLLGAPPTAEIYRMERVRRANGEPVAIMESSIVKAPHLEITEQALTSRSLYDLIHEQLGSPLTHGRETISCRLATARQAQLLHLSRPAALLRLRRLAFADDGRGIEYSTNWYAHSEVDIPLDRHASVVFGGTSSA